MKKLQRFVNSEAVNRLASVVTLVAFLLSILSYLLATLPVPSYLHQLSLFVQEHINTIYSVFILLALLYLYLVYRRLNRRLTIGFRDNFKGNLDRNWEYKGQWTIQDEDTLCVRASDEGGITKVGALWENYDFTFQAKIINKCSGWILRAQDTQQLCNVTVPKRCARSTPKTGTAYFAASPQPISSRKSCFRNHQLSNRLEDSSNHNSQSSS